MNTDCNLFVNNILTSTPLHKLTLPSVSEAHQEVMQCSPVQEASGRTECLNELTDSDVKCDECNYTGPLSTFQLHMCNPETIEMSESSLSGVLMNANISKESSSFQNINIEQNRIVSDIQKSPDNSTRNEFSKTAKQYSKNLIQIYNITLIPKR